MTAFHITAILVIVFLIILFIQFYEEGIPGDFIDWLACILLNIMIEVMIITVGIMLYGIWHLLYHLDWYSFFHDKVI